VSQNNTLQPTAVEAPAVQLEFQALTPLEQWRHNIFGQLAFAQCLWDVSRAPQNLSYQARDTIQKRISTRMLRHWQVKLELAGLEHLGRGPYLIASLHEGMADVLCLLQLPLPMRFVARREIFAWPLVGPAISKFGNVAIDPEHGALSFRPLLHAAAAILETGESVVMFPQGSVAGIEGEFQRGVFEIGKRLGVPILPVVLTGSHRIWEHPHSSTLRYGQRVGLRVLPEIGVDLLRSEPLERVRIRLQREMKTIALAGEMPRPRHYWGPRDGYWHGYRFDMDPDFPEVYADFMASRKTYFESLKAAKLEPDLLGSDLPGSDLPGSDLPGSDLPGSQA
jgi:1-acyl-sn-glycerol-3-phosphate acyltransferase